MRKEPGLVLSIGQFNQWVGSLLMSSGLVQIWPGMPVSAPLFEKDAVDPRIASYARLLYGQAVLASVGLVVAALGFSPRFWLWLLALTGTVGGVLTAVGGLALWRPSFFHSLLLSWI